MKELKYSLLYTSITQLICWILLFIIDECPFIDSITSEKISTYTSVILIIIVTIVYFKMIKGIIEKKKLNSLKFNLLLFFTWNIISFIIVNICLKLLDYKIIHACDPIKNICFLNGIEYVFFFITFFITSLLILSISMIIKIIKLLKDKKVK